MVSTTPVFKVIDMAVGRPTKYNKKYNNQVYKLALLGATDKEFADFFEVKEQTINNWKNKEPEFFESIKRGKVEADAKVAESLYNRALGYNYTEKRTEENPNGDIKTILTEKHIAADVAAQNIWLKNRRGKVNEAEGQRWADKQEHDHTTKGESINQITSIEVVHVNKDEN